MCHEPGRSELQTTLESATNIELDEVVVQDVSDDALELAAGGAQRGDCVTNQAGPSCKRGVDQ